MTTSANKKSKQPKTYLTERAKKAGEASKKHGIYAFEARGVNALNPSEVVSLRELREQIKSEPGRQEVREEIAARLVIVSRKVFNDMEHEIDNPDWWETGVVKRGATWVAELRRWLDSFSPGFASPTNVTEMLQLSDTEMENEPSS